MILLPAIDLMGGQVVRLQRGEAARKTVYSDDPVGFAVRWQNEGGDYLHVVDLDAAFEGAPRNLDVVRDMAAALDIPVELGGGLRTLDAVSAALEAGVARVIVGTRAVESLDFIRELVAEFGGERIAVGIDAKAGQVAVKGWTETTGLAALDLARQVEDAGAATIIYTDIATDGMLAGPNFKEVEALLAAVSCQVISSGGVSSADDLERLARTEGLYGAIIGKALYDGLVHLSDVRHLGGRVSAPFSSLTNHHEQ